tara:strand:+ start:589 stop:924 length:336 start_codon:yes stop_codon:yes gene_type:complete
MTVIFILTWVILFVFAVRLMSKGWIAADDAHLNKVLTEEKTRTVTRPPHPEMAEVKSGDELLVVNFNRRPEEPQDPLYKSLQDRMDSGQVEDPWDDEEEDDDDGDVVIGRR